jgi:ESS family glutamate:Na+ symporter
MPLIVDSIIVLALLLMLSRFLKRGSKQLQRFFIPSALIAGFAGLILGPQVLGTIPSSVTDYWSEFPKILINIVFAGLFLGKAIPSRKKLWELSGPMISFGNTLAWGQYVIGIALATIILVPVFGASPLSGALIEIGFEGGHGTAAGLAPSFQQLGWPEGTDLALALATISLVAAVISGVFLVNWRNRKHGYLIDEEAWKEQRRMLIRSGYNLVRFGQKFNTNPLSILSNVAAIAISIGLGYGMFVGLVWIEASALGPFTDLRFMEYVPLFPFAMIGGLVLQLFLRKVKRAHLIQRHTIQVICTIALDVLIASAVATISLNAIQQNLGVVIILSLAGFLWILGCFIFLAPRMFPDYWFENGITNTGQSMGMTATGLLMNRLADPTNKSHAREGFAYKQLAFEPFMGGGLVTATSVIVIAEFGSLFAFVTATIFMVFWLCLGLFLKKKRTTNN